LELPFSNLSSVSLVLFIQNRRLLDDMYMFFFFKELRKVYDRYHAQATGGGAYKFADDFLEKLGVCLDKLDEMDSVVSGANFLLQVSVSP